MNELFQKWKYNKLFFLEDEKMILEGKMMLPLACQSDLINAAFKSIDRLVHKANKQIRETIKLLNLPESSGVLFIVNDGNYFAEHTVIIDIIKMV